MYNCFLGGRIEAVLVSCPPLVAWDYSHHSTGPDSGSEEGRKMAVLKRPEDWSRRSTGTTAIIRPGPTAGPRRGV